MPAERDCIAIGMKETQAGNPERYNFVADAVATLLAAIALVVLALRAMLRLEFYWDTFNYHIPFAARRGGLGIPYELDVKIRNMYLGFPPLPHLVQGILWRATGQINATGVVNYLAFALFLYFCHRKLSARFSIVAIISLTAPLVLIHIASSLVDLFGNSLLAIGTSSLVAMYLFDRFEDRSLLVWGLAGLTGAAWTKYQLVPVVALSLTCFLVIYGVRRAQPKYRGLFRLVVIATLVASVPYIKNLVLYHNPVWPVRLPLVGESTPYTFDIRGPSQKPPPLRDLSQFKLFFNSLLEINHPTHYPNRPRWRIDQGQAWVAFRMGGFWNVAVITANAAIGVLALLWNRRKAVILLGSMSAMLCFVALLPQSHELRYYQFLPLTWAATIGMLLPRIRRGYPVVALTILLVTLGEFVYVSNINRLYYRVERHGYLMATRTTTVPQWWPKLERGKTYCAVGFAPVGIMLTGPTLHEFHIIDRSDARLCPPNVTVIRQK
jgi:hypothetical protein